MIDLDELKLTYPKVYSCIEFFAENYEKFEGDISVKDMLEKEGFDMAFDHFYEGVLGAESGAKNSNMSSKLLG